MQQSPSTTSDIDTEAIKALTAQLAIVQQLTERG